MSLENGLYMIRSLANNNLVARFPMEDRSLLPKRVMSFKGNQDPGMHPWIIEKCEDDTYTMKAGDAPVGERDGLLFAFLIEQEDATKWKVEPCPQMGENCFVITKPDQSAGWCVPEPDEDRVQVAVNPLIVHPTFPPRFPPHEVFVITRILE